MHWGFIDKTLVNTSGILFTAVLKGWSKCFHSINLKDQIYIHVYPECKAAIAARQTAIMIILHFPVILEWKQNKCIILFSTFLKIVTAVFKHNSLSPTYTVQNFRSVQSM